MNYSKVTEQNINSLKNNDKNTNTLKNNNIKLIEISQNVEESIELKWESKYSEDIIKLFHEIKYDFNYLLNKCEINNFMEFILKYSNIYDPDPILYTDDEEEETSLEDYFSN